MPILKLFIKTFLVRKTNLKWINLIHTRKLSSKFLVNVMGVSLAEKNLYFQSNNNKHVGKKLNVSKKNLNTPPFESVGESVHVVKLQWLFESKYRFQ